MFNLNHNQLLPLDTLRDIAEKSSDTYQHAFPFDHGVYDDVFAQELLDKVIEEFEEGEKNWKAFDSKYEKKYQMTFDEDLQPVTRAFIHNLNSAPFLDFLEKLTGIEGLIPDPYLSGGGLHKIPRGGKLGIHVDFNGHEKMDVYRRINVLIYLNKNWQEEWGGHFELWGQDKKTCEVKVLPVYNRMAIFSTTANSFHGHPEPLNCPEDRNRISLALYYYTSKDRGDQAEDLHSTQFLSKDGEREELEYKPGLLRRIKTAVKMVINPSA